MKNLSHKYLYRSIILSDDYRLSPSATTPLGMLAIGLASRVNTTNEPTCTMKVCFPVHTMKAYRGIIYIHLRPFLVSALNLHLEQSTSCPITFILGEGPRNPLNRRLGGLQRRPGNFGGDKNRDSIRGPSTQ